MAKDCEDLAVGRALVPHHRRESHVFRALEHEATGLVDGRDDPAVLSPSTQRVVVRLDGLAATLIESGAPKHNRICVGKSTFHPVLRI